MAEVKDAYQLSDAAQAAAAELARATQKLRNAEYDLECASDDLKHAELELQDAARLREEAFDEYDAAHSAFEEAVCSEGR